VQVIPDQDKVAWCDTIVRLVKRVTETVNPDVRGGDHLDIRPYVKLKIIPGGMMRESAYVDGVVFRKNVAHKKMVRDIVSPRVLLLSGGIEFQRNESRITSLEMLHNQEARYMEILVSKVL